jgi:hypothetical protein
MANEITIQYKLTEQPDPARESFKANPPAWIHDGGFKLVDETFNGLVYRGTNAASKWTRWLASGTYTLSLAFRSDNRFGTDLTITGQVPPKVAEEIQADAAAHGGGVDPRV